MIRFQVPIHAGVVRTRLVIWIIASVVDPVPKARVIVTMTVSVKLA